MLADLTLAPIKVYCNFGRALRRTSKFQEQRKGRATAVNPLHLTQSSVANHYDLLNSLRFLKSSIRTALTLAMTTDQSAGKDFSSTTCYTY